MKIKILILITAGFTVILPGIAQPKLTFDKKIHDFGDIIEGSIVQHEFVFTNTGSEPLIIRSVRASCGCTTPFWTSEPVKPGEKGMISAAYNSKGRPGFFNKTISVVSNASEPNVALQIKGSAIKEGEIVASNLDLSEKAALILPLESISLGKVEQHKLVPFEIPLKNSGSEDLKVYAVRAACNCIIFDQKQGIKVTPGEETTLSITFRPTGEGFTEETIYLFTNQASEPKTPVKIQAEIVKSITQENILREGTGVYKF